MITKIQAQPAQNTFGTRVDAKVEQMMGKELANALRNNGNDVGALSIKPINDVDSFIYTGTKGDVQICPAKPDTVKAMGLRFQIDPHILNIFENLPSSVIKNSQPVEDFKMTPRNREIIENWKEYFSIKK